ncbi:MAG: PqqD family protein [Actinobacteria bacterium]|nr:PqqD family protein [Actinomycetota bacterium]
MDRVDGTGRAQAPEAFGRNPRVVYRALRPGEGGVLLHLETGQYHGLNEVGAAVWDLLDGLTPAPRIAARLRGRLEDPPTDLDDVVESFLDELRHRDLVVEAGPPVEG